MARPHRLIKTALCTALLAASIPAPVLAADLSSIPVRQPGDTLMTCEQLWKEAYAMKAIILRTRSMEEDSKMQDRGIGAAGAVATLLISSATGGLGIGIAGFAAKAAAEQQAAKAERLQETAQQRRALMAGIFMIKDCEGPIEDALTDQPVRTTQEVVMAAIEPAADGTTPAVRVERLDNDRTAGTQVISNEASQHAGPHQASKADYND
jgi:hypothetical protein